ncbi:MAG TPA: malectin [Phycisphaerae bacterium]|nr:malectin [Phycisphaerae bacterium]
MHSSRLYFVAVSSLALLLGACATDNIHWGPKNGAGKPDANARVIRINFGREEPYKDSAGNTWLGDTGIDTGDVVDRGTELAIKNTRDPDLYRTEHWGMDAFTCKLRNGHYTLRLHFCETSEHIFGPGERVFTFAVEGREFPNFDVWAKSGGFTTPYIETVPVTIADGKLDITFTTITENPEINALEIIPD